MSGNAGGGGEQVEVNMTPLLDIVLQLIMFFMITVNFIRVDAFSDEIELPTSNAAAILQDTNDVYIHINLDKTGKLVGTLSAFEIDSPEKLRLFMVRERTDLELRAAERGIDPKNMKVVVVLRADGKTKNGQVWQAIDSCDKADYKHWQMRVINKKKL